VSIEYSIVVETYNLLEGTDPKRFRQTVQDAIRMASPNGEVLIADAFGLEKLGTILADLPEAHVISVVGSGYESAKMTAARAAAGKYILYIDADCEPNKEWHMPMLAALARGCAQATGGYTRYRGGFIAAVMSVMDFGFLLPRRAHDLKCYASNNCGFAKAALELVPMPQVALRSSCFYHTQLLKRQGIPMRFVPEATVRHDLPPLIRERTRRGYDVILACRVDPELPEALLARLGFFSVPFFYAILTVMDWKRMWETRNEILFWQVPVALALFPLLRCLDVAGMLRAFLVKNETQGWVGWG